MNRLTNHIRRLTVWAALLPTLAWAAPVDVIEVSGPITPVTAKYISDAVDKAEKSDAVCLIIEMDTPGGLMDATFAIDKKLLAADVPVIVYITPSGGRAASAGVYITYAAHLAAMAPSTNMGSAHPVTMGGQDSSKTLMEKITNDAVAHIKGLAEKRGRNAAWAEDAVRNSVSVTDKEARALGVIDIVAKDIEDLLKQLDGREVMIGSVKRTLRTANAVINREPMSWRYKVFDKLAHPNIVYILMMLGVYGLFFELSNPGSILPGVVGAIFLVLAFFTMQILPINTAGLLLILMGIIFFILEIKIVSHGLLAIGGIVSMVLGSLMLFKTPEMKVSLHVIFTVVAATAVFFFFAVGLGIKAQRKKVTTGNQGLIGERGVVVREIAPEGQVQLHGEIWKAVSEEKIRKGQRVEVTSVMGLLLHVKKVD